MKCHISRDTTVDKQISELADADLAATLPNLCKLHGLLRTHGSTLIHTLSKFNKIASLKVAVSLGFDVNGHNFLIFN